MVPWAFGVPLVLVSALGLILNGYVLLVVLGLGKQVTLLFGELCYPDKFVNYSLLSGTLLF